METNIVKFPHLASRQVHSRRPRKSNNGTPEERAATAAATAPIGTASVVGIADFQQRVPKTVSDDDWFRAFGARLRAARIDGGISEEQAAAAVGRSVTTWRKYEATGKGRSMTYIIGLCRDRHDAWQAVEAKLNYWRAYRELHSTIRRAQHCAVLDDLACPAVLRRMHGNFEGREALDLEILNQIRLTEFEILLTPAPTVAVLNWKKARITNRYRREREREGDADAEYLRKLFGQKPAPFRELDQSIADDEAWLAAHPARQSESNQTRSK